MKKALSLFLSVLMVLSLFSCLSVTTFALEPRVTSISFEAVSDMEAYEYTGGDWSWYYDEETGKQVTEYCYDFAYNIWEDGNKIILKYSDGTSVEYVCEGFWFSDEEGNKLDENPLYVYDLQYENPWEVGTNYVTIEYDGVYTNYPVEILESPVASVEFIASEPVELIQNVDGEEYIHELGPNAGNKYFSYSYDFYEEGNQLVLTYKDGKTETYESDGWDYYDENGDWVDLEAYYSDYDTQDIEPWTELGSYAFPFYYMGCKSEIPVTIVENPVADVKYFTDAEFTLVENYDGCTEYCVCEECRENDEVYFYYDKTYSGFPADGDKVVVTYIDGSEYTYTYNYDYDWFYTEDGESLPHGYYCDDNQYTDHWDLGTEYFYFCYMGKKVELPVSIVPNPVANISVASLSPIKIYEETLGYWDWFYDENGEEVEFYYYSAGNIILRDGVYITVEYTDGSEEVYYYDNETDWFVSENGEELSDDIGWYTDQYDEPWRIGQNSVFVEYYGFRCELVVTVVENPIESIEFKPAKHITFREYEGGYWDWYYDEEVDEDKEFYFYETEGLTPFEEGNTLKVNYTNGKSDTFTYRDDVGKFVNANGTALTSAFSVEYNIYQYDEPWVADSAYNCFEVEFMGRYDTVWVTIETGLPEAPEITDVYNGIGSVCVEWEYLPGATEYRVYRRGAGETYWTYMGTTDLNYFEDTKVVADGYYRYTVRSVNSYGYGGYDTTGVLIRYIAPVKNVAVSNDVKGVKITWSAYAGATCHVFRRGAGEAEWTYLGEAPGTAPYVIDVSITNNKYYRYAVIASKGNYIGNADMEKGPLVKFVSTPQLKQITNAVTGIYVNWNAIEGATGYRVYRRGAGQTTWTYLGTTKNLWFVDNAVKNSTGNYYRYTVRADSNGTFSGFDSNGLYIKRVATPEITGVSNNNSGIYVKWNKVVGATGYRVYRKTLNSGWTYLGTTKNDYYTDTAIKNNAGYYYGYTVIAVHGSTYSSYNTDGVMTKRLLTPALKSVVNANGGVQVSWNAVYGAAGYNVYRKTATSNWTCIGKASGTSYIDYTAVSGTAYTYTVRAYYGSYMSYYNTNGLTTKFVEEPQVNGPYSVRTGVKLSWMPVPSADKYHIYKKNSSGNWVKIKTIAKNEVQKDSGGYIYYVDTAVKNNTMYTYAVRADDDGYLSSYFNGLRVIYFKPADITSATSANKAITIKWNAVEGASGYTIVRKTVGDANSAKFITVGKDTTTYVDKNVISGFTYTYTVTAQGGFDGQHNVGATGQEKTCTAK